MKTTRITALLLIPMLLLESGCGKGGNHYPLPPVDAKAGSIVTQSGPFEIGSEKYDADYGTVTVPENRDKSTSRLIHIPFLRIHSRSQHPAEPVFALAGGPGASNMSWDWGKAWTFLPGHDVVLVGYRGVDGSVKLDCPEMTEALKEDGDVLGEESMEKIARAFGAGAQRMMSEGVDLDGYTMLETIEDNESVRKALGYACIDLLSESYGTRVAYLYGLRHPESIYRSAMIAVNPPGRFVWEPGMIDTQLRQYAALWAKDTAMSLRSPDLYATVSTVLRNMPHSWLCFSINPSKVKVGTFGLLFHRNTAAKIFDAYVAASQGDASGLALLSIVYDYLVPTMSTWGESASKAISADFDSSRDYRRDMEAGNQPLGSPMSIMLWGPSKYGRWPTRQLPREYRELRPSGVQTLLLSGSVDFSTPPAYATNDLLPYLSNGEQIIFSECGHVGDMWYANIENMRLILTSFYDTGKPDVSKNSYIPMDFSVNWGFPKIAKAALGGAAFLVLVLAALIIWFVRKLLVRYQIVRYQIPPGLSK